MNKQQEMQRYFDRAVSGILNQGCKSINKNGYCYYRGSNETKCAIGHLIPDELYSSKLEGKSFEQLLIANLVPIRWKRYSSFFEDLQKAHDNSFPALGKEFIISFKCNIRELAKKYNLNCKF